MKDYFSGFWQQREFLFFIPASYNDLNKWKFICIPGSMHEEMSKQH